MRHLIVITTPTLYPDEGELISSLFNEGLEKLHLRKPEAYADSLIHLLEQIPEEYYSRRVLHDHFEITTTFPVGGIHLNKRNTDIPVHFKGSVSRSCHSLKELEEWKNLDYLFLSPIFQSISKEGYGNGFPWNDLVEASNKGIITPRVFALGGMNVEQIQQTKDLNFGGAVVLGALWGKNPSCQEKENIIHRFNQLQRAIKEL